MCIRDSHHLIRDTGDLGDVPGDTPVRIEQGREGIHHLCTICLLYTSDAADERSSVDLGGRRIIKKKKYTK